MTHRGPFQPLPFCDSVMLRVEKVQIKTVVAESVCWNVEGYEG